MKKRLLWKKTLLTAGIALAVYFLLVSVLPVTIVYSTVTGHYEETRSAQERADGRTLRTADGEAIRIAEVLPEGEPAAVLVFLSGQKGPDVRGLRGFADRLLKEGYASVLVDTRAQGQSSGERIGLGFTEVEDLRAVTDYVRRTARYGDAPIIGMGFSMGAVTALNGLAEDPALSGVIAVSPYASYLTQFELSMKRYFAPPLTRRYVGFLIGRLLSRLYGDELVDARNPIDAVKKAAGRPVLLITTEFDSVTPSENSKMLSDACPEADLWIREGSAHLAIAENRFENAASDEEFVDRILNWLYENSFSAAGESGVPEAG